MPFRIAQRWLLVLFLVLLQALGLAVALFWFAETAIDRLQSAERNRIVERGATVLRVSGALASAAPVPDDPDAALRILEAALPSGAVGWLEDADGNPWPGTPVVPADGLRPSGPVGPAARTDGVRSNTVGNWLVTHLGGGSTTQPWRMVVAEPDTSVAMASGPEAARLRAFAGGAVLVLLTVLAAGSALLVQRYEKSLHARGRDIRNLRAGDAKNRQASRDAMILGLAKLADSRDSETGGHLERIRVFVRLLGLELIETHPEVDADFVEVLVEMCALHDIGKVGISDEVLHKPGPLTDEEREQIRRHPLIGGDTLLAVKRRWGDDETFVTACEIVFAHHERWDGSGYPFGLQGDIIPISARIVAVADVYDALTSARVYKDALSHTRAAEIIRAGSGTQFDPDVVDAFNRAEERFRAFVDDPDREPSRGFV